MNLFNLMIVIILVIISAFMICQTSLERFRGGGRGGRGRGGRGHGGRGHGGRGHRGRRWWGRGRGYGYGAQPSSWYYPQFQPSYFMDTTCKNGCTSIGNGQWGCQYPGTGSNDCMFSYDCNWCGTQSWWPFN
jgi:hypothetical protein